MTEIVHRLLLPTIFILTALMFLAVIAQVFFRYVLAAPLPWSEELARYLMIWVACLAASEAYHQKSHVGVNLLSDLLPVKLRRWLHQIVHLVILVLMLVIIYQGFTLSWLLLDQMSPALGIPMTWPYLSVPVGASFIALHTITFLVQGFKEQPQENQKIH